MATSINSMLSMGNSALGASQAALQTTGNNVSNVNTVGYSRQSVRLETWPSLDYVPGQIGQGVRAAEVLRHFDQFVERNYLNSFSTQNRWTAVSTQMRSVEAVFNESTGYGISSLLSDFYNAWEDLSQAPDDLAAREALIGATQNLTEYMRTSGSSLSTIQDRVDTLLLDQVQQANQLMQEIAELNRQINMHSAPGNNPNSLLDLRDQKARQLSSLIDVDVINKGDGNYIINTKGGFTLVDGTVSFELAMTGADVYQTPSPSTTFDGDVIFDGLDGYEYTLEFVTAGTLGNADAMFRVSLDGGKTWIKDENGNDKLFTARDIDSDSPTEVKDLTIGFKSGSGGAGDQFNEGDRFVIVPKSHLQWISPTIGPINVSAMQYADGTINETRVNGGSIGGNLLFRDYMLGETIDSLDAFASELIWQVNRLHSQGAGLQMLTNSTGTYSAVNKTVALGSDNSGLFFKDKLGSGNFSISLYDRNGKPLIADTGLDAVLNINFDPNDTTLYTTSYGATVEAGSLEALADRINTSQITLQGGVNTTLDNYVEASIVNGSLQLKVNSNNAAFNGGSFALGNDTTGLMAALGVNTFFTGTTASDISVRSELVQNKNLINAAHVNGGAEANAGDAAIAKQIGELANTKVEFLDWTGKKTSQTLGAFYATLVASVGSKTQVAEYQEVTSTAIATEYDERQSEVAGVNLDEEMTNLIKFQSSYKAAAKLITTADQMLQTLLSLKQ